MLNFFICILPMNKDKYYQTSLSIDVLIILTTLVAYFSNELIVSPSIVTVSTIFTINFSVLLVVSAIKYFKGINNI